VSEREERMEAGRCCWCRKGYRKGATGW
jgi:hypothetical protein